MNITGLTAASAVRYLRDELGEDGDVAVNIIAAAAELGTASWDGDDVQPQAFQVIRTHEAGKTVFEVRLSQ